MDVRFTFTGKIVVVTGGSRGIGRAVVDAFLVSGARVVSIAKHAHDIPGCECVQLDITDTKELRRWVERYARKKRIDIWVNNAGIYPAGELDEITEEEWDGLERLNLRTLLFASQAVARQMRKRGGVIINASSFAARMPSLKSGAYGAMKAAVENLTQSMAAQWARYGIRVNAYAPGVVRTDMTREVIAKKKSVISPIALSRVGTPEEVALPVLFLCSDAARYITGISLDISGGKFLIQDQGGVR